MAAVRETKIADAVYLTPSRSRAIKGAPGGPASLRSPPGSPLNPSTPATPSSSGSVTASNGSTLTGAGKPPVPPPPVAPTSSSSGSGRRASGSRSRRSEGGAPSLASRSISSASKSRGSPSKSRGVAVVPPAPRKSLSRNRGGATPGVSGVAVPGSSKQQRASITLPSPPPTPTAKMSLLPGETPSLIGGSSSDQLAAIRIELDTLQNAVRHLIRSQSALEDARKKDPADKDFKEAMEENALVLVKKQARIKALQEEIAKHHMAPPPSPVKKASSSSSSAVSSDIPSTSEIVRGGLAL